MTNKAVSSIAPSEVDWIGELEPQYLGQYFDYGMLLVFGGIPWQVKYTYNMHYIYIEKETKPKEKKMKSKPPPPHIKEKLRV